MSQDSFDLVVLGGGSGGYAAAIRATELGMSVALVEADKLGGTCLHRGCIPTKALLHAAEVADVTRESAEYGILAEFKGVDMVGVNAYRDNIVSKKFKGLQGLIKQRGIEVIEGRGMLTSPTTVTVGDRTLTGTNIVLATGSYSKSLPGLDIGGRVITSETALLMDYVPNRVAILGGG
ncbi:MAG: FAD-dependent oxidoreductase, partial [Actinobacteria bacterium]|nr:FAD-dependent oxidoreductase [Actinomycetota bacterium]